MFRKLPALPVRCCVWMAQVFCGGCIEGGRAVGKGMVKGMHRASDAALDVVEDGVTGARDIRKRVGAIKRGEGR